MSRAIIAAVYALVLGGCSAHPLEAGRASATALAEDVLDALQRGDEAGLMQLAVSEDEFRKRVWPELPAAQPQRNLPAEYVWGELQQKSGLWAGRLVAAHRGRRFQLESVDFARKPTQYATYVIHPQPRFVVRDTTGATETLRVMGAMIEADGRWKVFSYIADD